MISAPTSQALLSRTALRNAAAVSSVARLTSALAISNTSSHAGRSMSVSAISRNEIASASPTSTPAAEPIPSPAPARTLIPTSGRKKRGKPTSEADKAKCLLKWGWFKPSAPQITALANALGGTTSFPEWLRPTFDLARSFRSARARLWLPSVEQLHTLVGADANITDAHQWIEQQKEAYRKPLEDAYATQVEKDDARDVARAPLERQKASLTTKLETLRQSSSKTEDKVARRQLKDRIKQVRANLDAVLQSLTVLNAEALVPSIPVEEWDLMDHEQQVDYVLRRVWEAMSESQRSDALLRLRYHSIRKLGWRQGYSSGYPRPEGESSHLPDKLGARGNEGVAAFHALQKAEEENAWAAWQRLTPEERVAEEKAAWKLRDRSQVYIDDSDDSMILSHPAPRWYAVPERAGELTFLPNVIVKLVKNYTPPGQEYDAFKATFRVPLSMHKHALRSYLLAIYGLKTTWARSSIYRSPVTRDSRTGKVISGRGRTHKKVEVGLLEPFLFPEVSPDFQKQHLLTSELDYERSRVYLKMTKTTRWRGRKSTEQYESEIANKDEAMYHGLDPLASEGIKVHEAEQTKEFPRFMVKTKGLPSAKQGKILQLLNDERRKKEERVEALVRQFKKDALQQPSS